MKLKTKTIPEDGVIDATSRPHLMNSQTTIQDTFLGHSGRTQVPMLVHFWAECFKPESDIVPPRVDFVDREMVHFQVGLYQSYL